jgi:hypothetical protein
MPSADLRTYTAYDPDDFEAGGAVYISCECGFNGFVEVDDDGHAIIGECEKCFSQFRQPM